MNTPNPFAIIAQADNDAADIPLRLDTDKIQRRACFTCNGTGHSANTNGSPSLCLDCLGEGHVPANRKAQLALRLAYVDRQVAMLERQLQGARDALDIAEANLAFALVNDNDTAPLEATRDEVLERRDTIADALASEAARLADLFDAFTA